MADTNIEWATKVWNPITGCTPVSPGCDHCYAQRMATRLRGRCGYPKEEPFRPGCMHGRKLAEPLGWTKPQRVFVCSMGDLFHGCVDHHMLAGVFAVMKAAKHHTFMVLTKRPARMRAVMPYLENLVRELTVSAATLDPWIWPLPNVWLGVSAENQAMADERIPLLLDTPAAKHFVSVEPMLGPVHLAASWIYATKVPADITGRRKPQLDWVICGGETGPGARPMDYWWAKELRQHSFNAGIPFFFKKPGDAAEPGNQNLVWTDGDLAREVPV